MFREIKRWGQDRVEFAMILVAVLVVVGSVLCILAPAIGNTIARIATIAK